MVLTGFNTDIQHDGMTYHVQTEDKGRSNPFVESLVYARGEILYSRRTPYHDLVEQDLNPKAVANLMERQHRTIVEAIRRGRLPQLTGTAEDISAEEDTNISPPAIPAAEAAQPESSEPSLDQVILDYLAAQRGQAHLVLRATGVQDYLYGAEAQVEVVAIDSHSNEPQSEVRVTVLFKSTAEPRRLLIAEGETDDSGEFLTAVEIPDYNGGTSAVVITGESALGQSEIKHLVHR
ncbi:MAG: hypothetical protein GY906_25545 [bacterium]|nr:hypothetical protein [bacterium]